MATFENTLPSGTILQGPTYRYRIIDVIGQGSFGIAYKAEMYYKTQDAEGRLVEKSEIVAIKEFFIKKLNGREGSSVTEESSSGIFTYYKKEFENEANNLRYMVHPHIVKVHEMFYANDTVYYSMEYLANRTLDDVIKEKGKLTTEEALKYLQEFGSALSFMHDYKMLHLDLKPSNIMIDSEGEAVLIDFGLSKRYTHDGTAESATDIGKGTPGYAPLEQTEGGGGTDFAATMDIYALGATLYKMLTGKRAPEALSVATDGFPAYELQDSGVEEWLMPVVAKAMNPERKGRYQSVDELLKAATPEPDREKADQLEKEAQNAEGMDKIRLLKKCFAADPTRGFIAREIEEHYLDGHIVKKDYTQAAEWCLKAAKLGYEDAQRDIADMYSCGDGVPMNHYIAVKWYREAAKNGNKYAPAFLADSYFDGKGVPQDYYEAYRWYQRAVEVRGDEATQPLYALGCMHEKGLGVEQDYAKAAEYWRRVADFHKPSLIKMLDTVAKVPDCIFKLGYLYQHGLDVPLDYEKAEHYYRKAMEYDYANAFYNLGCMYFFGEGRQTDQAKGLELWYKTTEVAKAYDDEPLPDGAISAYYNLGACCEMGWGCAVDFENALAWYEKAAEWGHSKANDSISGLRAKMEAEKKTGFKKIFKKILKR